MGQPYCIRYESAMLCPCREPLPAETPSCPSHCLAMIIFHPMSATLHSCWNTWWCRCTSVVHPE
eukprot:jgi/Mesvir1/6015/Mv00760-RA.1